MAGRAAAYESAVLHLDMAGKQHIICDDHLVPDLHIVAEMGAGHEEIVIAHRSHAPFGSPAMDGAIFPDGVVVADGDLAFDPGIISAILGSRADDCAVADGVIFPESHRPVQHCVGLNDATRAYDCRAIDADIGANLDIVRYFRLWVDDGGGVDFHKMPASLKL